MSTDAQADARRPATLQLLKPGRLPYDEGLALQEKLIQDRIDERITDTLVLLEHPPVITLGRSGAETDIVAAPAALEQNGVTVHRIGRGGEATYHGPGQLVGYPIIHLYERARDIRRFVFKLEEVFVRLLSEEYGIAATRDDEHRGVWVENEKVTAVGIAIRNRVTMHGFAFNVNTDLSHFSWIIPCGIRDRGQTSLAKLLGHELDSGVVEGLVERYFREVFGYSVVSGSTTSGSASSAESDSGTSAN
ncbi:MAG: lipoyl(octanoyl) transferase LipB [Spirochaetaceae bacterium]|nr:MAG: lipoyl(octanoyl) transferase LipB [Spirochaetaceae bacterium]